MLNHLSLAKKKLIEDIISFLDASSTPGIISIDNKQREGGLVEEVGRIASEIQNEDEESVSGRDDKINVEVSNSQRCITFNSLFIRVVSSTFLRNGKKRKGKSYPLQ